MRVPGEIWFDGRAVFKTKYFSALYINEVQKNYRDYYVDLRLARIKKNEEKKGGIRWKQKT